MPSPSGHVTKLLLAALMLFLLAPIAVMLYHGGEPALDPPDGGPTDAAAGAPSAAPDGPEGAPAPAADRTAGSLVATRTLASSGDSEPLPDTVNACLCVVDRETQAPVAGAMVRKVQGGGDLAFTDERGLAGVPLRQPEQLAVIADGYLLRLSPTQPGSSEAEPQRVLLVRDRWSVVCRFDLDARGANVAEAFVRFRPQQANGAAAQPPGPGRDDPVVARAWSEHTMLAGQPVGADQLVQLGVWSQDRVHRLADGGTVRFTAPGDYVVEAATPGGHVGRAAFRADNFSAGKIVRIPLERGRFVAGTVVGAVAGAPAPLRGAELTLQGGDPLGLVATTGGDGGFRIGPLLPGEITLLVRHGDHEPLAFGPVAGDGLRIVLRPLPQTALRGRVRARPGGQPIAGARLSWAPEGAAVVTALSGEDGTFQLAATGARAARLMIGAPGFVPYVELVEPGAAFLDYDLWPASPDERLALGLTARLVGSVVDRGGTPLQGVSVRWIPARLVPPPGVLGRRVLDGATLDLPRVAATGTDGAFVLEVSQFGPGRVCLAAAGPDATGGVAVEAVAGRTVDGLRLMQ